MKERYNTYSKHIKEKYGERVQKITVDAGFTCPNRDGSLASGGCIYCNNQSFSPQTRQTRDLDEQIRRGIEAARHKYKAKKYFIYFQSFSNTYGTLEHLKELYGKALSYDGVVGLCIGTRPDCVDPEKLDYLSSLSKNYDITVEYGLESVFDDTLVKINRGHSFKCFEDAVKETKERNIKICTHLILGFPWENREMWIDSSKILSKYPIDYLKVHNLHVVANTRLYEMYRENPFKTLGEDEYMEIIIEFLEHLNPKIIVQRLISDTPKDLLIAPKWEISSSQFMHKLKLELDRRSLWQGMSHLSQP